MAFDIQDDFNEDDVIIAPGENEIEVSPESLGMFFGVTEEVPKVELKLTGKDEKSRTNEISNFILGRIVSSITSGHKRDWVIRHAAKTMDLLANQAGVELNNSESNAIGLYKKARQFYALGKLKEMVAGINESYGLPKSATILNSDKPRFTTSLFHSLAEQVHETAPSLQFDYVAGRKTENFRFDDATGLKAIKHLQSECSKIVKIAKAAGRDLTDEESADLTTLKEEIKVAWQKFFVGAKSVLGSANALFPEQITTGRTTTSAVFKGVSTLDSINFGAFEL